MIGRDECTVYSGGDCPAASVFHARSDSIPSDAFLWLDELIESTCARRVLCVIRKRDDVIILKRADVIILVRANAQNTWGVSCGGVDLGSQRGVLWYCLSCTESLSSDCAFSSLGRHGNV